MEIIAQEGGSARTIAAHASLNKSTVHNILATLEKLDCVRRRETDSKYYLGERIMNLSRIVGDDGSLRTRLRPIVDGNSKPSGRDVYLAVPSGDQIFYIDGIDVDDPEQRCSRVGARRPPGGRWILVTADSA